MIIPLRIRLLHNFGRSSFVTGFLFAIIGLSFVMYFSSVINWKILLAGEEDFFSTTALITEINETRYSVNDEFLFEYHYNYSLDDELMRPGVFLESEGAFRTGQEIQIDYLITDPNISRYSGKDRSNLNQIMLLAGAGGTLVGFFFLFPSVRKTRRERKILLSGRPVKGKLIHAEPTNMSVNEQTVYKLTFEYSVGNNTPRQFSTRSHMLRNLSEEHVETMVYDPRQPSRALIVDTLPGPVARFVNSKIDPQVN
jgi:hypothetical protein